MQLQASGIININGYHCLFTLDGQWSISRHGIPLGYVDTLGEVEAFVTSNLERVRARLRRANDAAEARRLEDL